MLYLLGSQGSGKTTRGLILANVLEPQAELGAVLKKSERENNPVAEASFILTADNMTKMSGGVSKWLCSLVTGHRVQERKLYTSAEWDAAWERVESIMDMAATAYPNDVDERDRRFGPLIEAGMRHLE